MVAASLPVVWAVLFVAIEMISTDSTCRKSLGVGRIIWPRSIYGFQATFCLMRKLTWFGSILLTIVVCKTSVLHAQRVRYEYAGPLDRLQTVPLSDVITSGPTHRVAGLRPARKPRQTQPAVSRVAVSRITGVTSIPPSRQARTTRQVFSTPRPTQAARDAVQEVIPPPAFSGPLTEATGQVLRRKESSQRGYSGALTDPRSRPAETNFIPQQEDPAQFGSSSRSFTDPRSLPREPVYAPRQEDPFQYGQPRTRTTPRSYQPETNFIPQQEDPAQFGSSSRSFTDPRSLPREPVYAPRQEDPFQYGQPRTRTTPRSYQPETNFIPQQEDPAQFGSSSRSFTDPRSLPREPVYVPRQEDAVQYGHPRTRTTPRSYQPETNYAPRREDPAQYGSSSRSFTNPRTSPVENNYVRGTESDQYGYSEAFDDPRNYPVETDNVPFQDDQTQFGFAGTLTDSGGYQTEAGYLPRQEDPTRFGYRDGEAFGFDNTRLFNPLEGPQLNLQGSATVDFGEPGCDEWANFGKGRELEFDAPCGGLKAKPGHLGIPWLGSKDNCDERVPLRGSGCLCRRKKGHAAEKVCESCGSCPTCGR